MGDDGKPIQMMAAPTGAPAGGDCPPGLEYLAALDQVLIKQIVELFEALTGWETNNRYRLSNSMGQQFAFSQEETSCFQRQCCGPVRGFVMHITDNNGQEIIRLQREFKCCAGCGWCACASCEHCAFRVYVESPPGNIIGCIRQEFSCCKPAFTIRDESDAVISEISGPICWACVCPCNEIDFPIVDTNAQEIGRLSRQWGGGLKEICTDASTFSLSFPMELPVQKKALILSAVFLIDMMYYEQKNNNS